MQIKVQATVLDDDGRATVCELELLVANVQVTESRVEGDAVTEQGIVLGHFEYAAPSG